MTTRITLEGTDVIECAQQARDFADKVLGVVRVPAQPAKPRPAAAPEPTDADDAASAAAGDPEPQRAAPKPAPPKKKAPSADDVIAAMRDHSKAVNKESAIKTLNDMGYTRASEVPADKRQAVIDALAKNEAA